MPTLDEQIAIAEQQEKELQFEEFTSETALEIGLAMIDYARKNKEPLSIDIRRNGIQLFHYCSEGATPDNDRWLTYKANTVNLFHTSSYLWGLKLKKRNQTPQDVGLSHEYAPWPGGFPIIVKNVGVVGSFSVSGLKGYDEQDVLVKILRKVLAK